MLKSTRRAFFTSFSFKFVLAVVPVESGCLHNRVEKYVRHNLWLHNAKLGYTRHRTSINFLSVISMNNYDVNLCNTNRRLPNGGVAAKEKIEHRKVESGNVLVIYHLNATHMPLLLMPFARQRTDEKKHETFIHHFLDYLKLL